MKEVSGYNHLNMTADVSRRPEYRLSTAAKARASSNGRVARSALAERASPFNNNNNIYFGPSWAAHNFRNVDRDTKDRRQSMVTRLVYRCRSYGSRVSRSLSGHISSLEGRRYGGEPPMWYPY